MSLSTEKVRGKGPSPESAPARKFMFDLSFDNASVVHRAPERKPVLMKPDQIDALKKDSHDEGFLAGKKEGLDQQTAALIALLSAVEQNIATLVACMDAMAKDQEAHTRCLALAIAKKVLPAFTAQQGLQEIEALVNATLHEMEREPRLVVRVEESQFDALNEKIQALAAQRAYGGKIVIIADAAVASGDCRIEWADGGVARDTAATMSSIEKTVRP